MFASFPMIRSRNADSQQYILTILIADNNSSIAMNEVWMSFLKIIPYGPYDSHLCDILYVIGDLVQMNPSLKRDDKSNSRLNY